MNYELWIINVCALWLVSYALCLMPSALKLTAALSIQLKYSHECFLWNFYIANTAHALLPFFLLFK